jgi:hypothetical protein
MRYSQMQLLLCHSQPCLRRLTAKVSKLCRHINPAAAAATAAEPD